MKNVILAEPATLALLGLGLLVLTLLSVVTLACILAIRAKRLGGTFFGSLFGKRPEQKTPLPPAAPATQIIPRKCPQCGGELKPGVSEGLCPACLLQRGIATEGGVPPGTPPFVPPTISDLARLFPQFEILELIGKGGMGAVYKARQPALDRFVALKILAPRSSGDLDFAGRFTREARALAKLSHPNIVAVYDFGQADQLSYFIMEHVDGPNLRQVEQAGKLSAREALEIIPQICAALQFAHDEGIVHRDIKPENVLLDKKGRVKIADFGLAKILGQEAKDFRLTGARDVVGTPHYMAPEQVEKPQEVDHRADIYSLGVVFYEMLTGELPLGKFPPPSTCARGLQIDVRLDEVVLHALEKAPERRYQQASEIKTRVENIAQTPPGAGAGLNPAAFIQAALAQDYTLNIGHCLARAWQLVAQDFWPIIGVAALIGLLQSAAHSTLIGIVVSGPLAGGLWLYFLKKIRGETADVGTAFSGFTVAFVPLFLGSLVTFLFVLAGLVCLLLPGIYLAVAWAFTLMLIADRGLEFWPAMALSRQVISKHWWKFLWFFIVLGLIELAGLLACLIGLFVAAPIAMAALAYAYEDIFGPAARAAGNAPAGQPAAPSRPNGGWGTIAGVAAGVAAAVVFITVLGLLAAIAIPNVVRGRHQSQQHAAQQWTQEGWRLWQARELDKAAAKFRQAVQLAPDNADAWNGLGWATFNSGKSQEAEQAFQQAILLDTNQPGALNGLGQIYLSQRNYDQAEVYLLKAAPRAPAAWYGLARLFLLEGKFGQAESWAQKLIDSGQADDLVRQMFKAAQDKYLSDGLRLKIEPPPSRDTGGSSAGQTSASSAPAAAETWAPTLQSGEKPDLQKMLTEAKELMDVGHYEEALQRHVWYHNHALEYDQGQTGVRLSFALADWVELGRRYPKATQALIEIRDRAARQFQAGGGYSELFSEVSAINRELQDDNATLALFKTIQQQDKPLAGQCYYFAEDLLMQHGEYQLCRSCIGDPQARFEAYRRGLELHRESERRMEEMRKQYPGPVPRLPGGGFKPPDMGQLATNSFVGQVCKLVEILVATGSQTDAEKIRDQAVAVLDDPRLKSAVSDAEAQVKKVRDGSGAASPKTTSHFVTRFNQIIQPAQTSTNVPPTPPIGPGYIDPATGLPVGPHGAAIIDPTTGLPVGPDGTGSIDPATGLPFTNASNGSPAPHR